MFSDLLTFTTSYLHSMHIGCVRFMPPFMSLADYDNGLRHSVIIMPDDHPPLGESGLIEPDSIYHLTDRFDCTYALMTLPETGEYMLVGPMLLREMTDARFYTLMEKLGLPQDFHPQMRTYYNELPPAQSTPPVFSLINQLGETLYGEEKLTVHSLTSEQMEVWEGFFGELELQITTDPILSVRLLEERYKNESNLLEYIHAGNANAALSLFGGGMNILADRLSDSLRNMKYLMVTLNTLMRKEVQRAYVHPLHIDSLSNSLVVKIDRLSSVTEGAELIRKMVKSYCELVRRHSLRGYSPQTQKIITAIDADLKADLSLKRFAAELNINASYLSTLFKNDTGQALTDYVNTRRLARAKTLLRSTPATVQTIATDIGIPDVHYFGRIFKRETGMTPKGYRNFK